jgi:hypothetical protein
VDLGRRFRVKLREPLPILGNQRIFLRQQGLVHEDFVMENHNIPLVLLHHRTEEAFDSQTWRLYTDKRGFNTCTNTIVMTSCTARTQGEENMKWVTRCSKGSKGVTVWMAYTGPRGVLKLKCTIPGPICIAFTAVHAPTTPGSTSTASGNAAQRTNTRGPDFDATELQCGGQHKLRDVFVILFVTGCPLTSPMMTKAQRSHQLHGEVPMQLLQMMHIRAVLRIFLW